jgi:hypothetical protein
VGSIPFHGPTRHHPTWIYYTLGMGMTPLDTAAATISQSRLPTHRPPPPPPHHRGRHHCGPRHLTASAANAPTTATTPPPPRHRNRHHCACHQVAVTVAHTPAAAGAATTHKGNRTRVSSAGENLSTRKDKNTLPPLSAQPVPSHEKICTWRYRVFPTIRSGRMKG